MKLTRTLLLVALAVLTVFASALAYGWLSEMAYTEHRQESYDRANDAMSKGDADPNRHIIRPPVEDRTYYK